MFRIPLNTKNQWHFSNFIQAITLDSSETTDTTITAIDRAEGFFYAPEVRHLQAEDLDVVLLDLDGTLVDSHFVWQEVDRQFFERHGLQHDESYLTEIQGLSFEEIASLTKRKYSLKASEEEILAEWFGLAKHCYAEEVQTKAGAEDFLRACQAAGLPMILFTACLPALVEILLEKKGWRAYFQEIVFADSAHNSKYNPDFYLRELEKRQYRADRCLLVDDLPGLQEALVETGIQVVPVYDALWGEKAGSVKDLRSLLTRPELYLQGEALEIYGRLRESLEGLSLKLASRLVKEAPLPEGSLKTVAEQEGQTERREAVEKVSQSLPATMPSLALAFSGGVDSSLLYFVCSRLFAEGSFVAYFASAVYTPSRERAAALQFAEDYALPLRALNFDLGDLPQVRANPVDRCYHCKKALFSAFLQRAKEEGLALLLEGSNVDDLSDFRPGRRALEELQVYSPLVAAGMGKREIRLLSEALGLPTWNHPSLACLATRIPTDVALEEALLKRIDLAENFLIDLGFHQLRVRLEEGGRLARLEIAASEIPRLMEEDLRLRIVDRLRELGFERICLDLAGYRMGSMNPHPQ